MGKYVYIYHSGKASDGGSNEDWMNWFSKLGDKLIDGGNPFKDDGQALHQGSAMPVKDMPATGYSIVNAKNMEEAIAMAKGCPLALSKDASICVYEALPM